MDYNCNFIETLAADACWIKQYVKFKNNTKSDAKCTPHSNVGDRE